MRAHRSSRVGIAVLSVVALVASGASPIAAAPVPAFVAPVTALTMPVRPSGLAIDASGNAYVAGWDLGSGTEVLVFDASGAKVDAKKLTGLSSPWDVAVHPVTGEILVSNWSANTVSVFSPGGSLSRTLTGVPGPTGVAVTSTGLILVASYTGGLVHVFEGTNTTESRTINVVNKPAGIAADPIGNHLYVTYPDNGQVRIFSIDSGILLPGGIGGLVDPYDIALQPQTGTFFVTDYAAAGGSLVYAFMRGSVALDAARSLNGLVGPWGVAVSPLNGAVYVSDRDPSEVHLFPAVTSSVTGVDPAVGPLTGGTAVNVNGTNLGAVTQVTFNGVVAEQTGPALPNTLPVKVPAGTVAGPVTVQVKWAGNIAGKVDAFTYTPVAPGKATEVFGARGNKQVTVSWKAPAFTGGVPIASYLVTPSPSGAPCATTSTSCTIGGLTNGAPYTFTVTTTNTASLTSVSDVSPAVTPVIALSLKVKAKKASYRPGRWGTSTLVSWAKKSTKANRMVTRTCTNGTGLSSSKLCKFTVYKTGKVKVRTKGFKNVVVTISIVAVPKASAGPTYGPSPTWSRTWRVR